MNAYDLLVRRIKLAVVLTTLVPALSEAKNSSRLFPHYKHEIGALRLAEVVAVASRTDIVDSGSH